MLPKENRLQKNREFQKIFRKSFTTNTKNLIFKVYKNPSRTGRKCRFGFVVSNKIEKRATKRNALRRRLRKITYNLLSEFSFGYDVIVVVKTNFPIPYNYNEIKDQFVEETKKARLLN